MFGASRTLKHALKNEDANNVLNFPSALILKVCHKNVLVCRKNKYTHLVFAGCCMKFLFYEDDFKS